jgi:molybdenum cofactor cytidylyltransferase
MMFDEGRAAYAHPDETRRTVAALVLGAGKSSRMAPTNKLLTTNAAGRSMIGQVVDATLASTTGATLVVVGHQADQVMAALAGRAVTFIHAPDFGAGLSASLRAGISALPEWCSAILVCLGDMPLVTPALIDRVVGAYDPAAGHLIVVPTHLGQRGNPVLWDRRFWPDIMGLTGDSGARALLLRHAGHVVERDLGSDAVLRDFDTPEALAALP